MKIHLVLKPHSAQLKITNKNYVNRTSNKTTELCITLQQLLNTELTLHNNNTTHGNTFCKKEAQRFYKTSVIELPFINKYFTRLQLLQFENIYS